MLRKSEIQFAHVFNTLEGSVIVIFNPMVSAPYKETFPIFDIDNASSVQAAIQFCITHTIFIDVSLQFIIGNCELFYCCRLGF